MLRRRWVTAALVLALALLPSKFLLAQADQGTITGVVQDPTGAVISKASVTLTSVDTGLVLKSTTDGSGVYVFSPVKIGNYSVTASAPGFATTTQTNLHLSLQQRLNVVVTLQPGATTQTVTVTTEAPLMQTQESSVGQVMDTKTIDSIPLNGRNWVFIAQLAAGSVPPEGSRGAGKGDFNANGQRAEQNNFILDGVDNNANVVDFYNGASFVAQPPPDALAEFKVQTGNYSAEFGHSAGAVINASLKSGTNNLHGSAWEYIRNTVFDTHDWNAGNLPVAPYHENQFGATLGLPLIRNKLFFFGDAQANRITFSETQTLSVPTALERQGDFSELLDSNLTGNSPVQLYNQTSSAPPVAFANNCLVTSSSCTSSVAGVTLNPTAQAVLNLYPMPNTNGGKLYSNYVVGKPVIDNTFQWDARMDWNISSKDTTYSRFSYWNEMGHVEPPLGNVLDGGGFGDDGKQKDMGENFMISETHVFTQTMTNEARLGYNWIHTGFQHPNAENQDFADSVGFGGIPKAPLNGGLPSVSVSGIDHFGSPTWSTTDEHQNVYQILDNVTKIAGSHALKAGVSFQSIRFSTLQPQQSRGSYNYTGVYTSNLNASNTGYGVADFLLDMQNSAGLSNQVTNGDARWDNAAYFQDDWRVTQKLTLNLGVRWEHFQPYQDVGGYQASFNMTGPSSLDTTTGFGSGAAQYQIPEGGKSYAENIFQQTGNAFPNVLAMDNIALVYTPDPHIVKSQKTNFAPRVGVAWSPNGNTVVRAGFGIFYGGLESTGYWPNLGENYPFQYAANFPSNSCGTYSCPTDGITIANGFSTIIANGFATNVTNLTMRGSDPVAKTPYTEDYNLALERGLTSDIVATVSYVGNVSRHMQVFPDPNNPLALQNPSNSAQNSRPLPHFGGSSYTAYAGASNYNALQTKLEKRLSKGYSLLATYTWSHARDDAPTPLGSTGDSGFRQTNLIPINMDYSNSPFDTRHRLTLNVYYDLPFGAGRSMLNHTGVADYIIGGWSANATFVAQTGNPFSVSPSGNSGPNNGGRRAIKTKDPFATGGTFTAPDPSLVASVSCATKTRNRKNWYNPCSFKNPWSANDPTYELAHYIPTNATDAANTGATMPVYVTDLSDVVGYLGGRRNEVVGPGYERVNMSIFKNFKVYHEQTLTFRTDMFNLFNTPSLAQPSNAGISSTGGQITAPRSLQRYAPDSRFFQLSLRYAF
ncbi:MAG TPA: TonB-dependent receptor [Terracidiphilus sp.]|nr:TonB-dependent receptor [Terracidiphilus sp.]